MKISLCNYKDMTILALTSVFLTFGIDAGAQSSSVNNQQIADEKYPQ